MYHLFKCEAKYLEQLKNGNGYIHELFSLTHEGETYFLIFKVLPDLINRQDVSVIDVKNCFNSLKHNIPELIWITRPDCYPL